MHYGRVNPEQAREVMIREGIMMNKFRVQPSFLKHLAKVRENIRDI